MNLTIRVDKCIDSDEWVWSLLAPDGCVYCDGYSSSEKEAWQDARRRRRDENALASEPNE